MIYIECLFCNKIIQKNKLKVRGKKPKFCGRKCIDAYYKKLYFKPKRVSVKCGYCQTDFTCNGKFIYCSVSCRTLKNNERNRAKKSKSVCTICGSTAIGSNNWIRKYCSFDCQIKGIYGGKPPLSERSRKAQRNMRERHAPGLTYLEIRRLRIQWQKDGLVCVYCAGPFDTIDHVVPLTRGGDNMKSNLVPACRSCNSSKGQKLLSEWMPHLASR